MVPLFFFVCVLGFCALSLPLYYVYHLLGSLLGYFTTPATTTTTTTTKYYYLCVSVWLLYRYTIQDSSSPTVSFGALFQHFLRAFYGALYFVNEG